MAQISAGIDISDDLLTGVAVAGAGRDAQVTACASLFRHQETDRLAEELPQLMERLGLSQPPGRCIVGLSLSCLSLHNSSLPFTDEKKIRQVLPFELEEQLLLPMEVQVVATSMTSVGEDKTALLAAAAEKETLRRILDVFRSCGLEPERVCPALHVLADRLCRTEHTGSDFLLLYGEVSAVQMALVRQGEILFMRRLAWPDEVFTHAVFRYEKESVSISAAETEAAAAVSSLCNLVWRSLDYFALQNALPAARPEYFVLSGPMLLCPNFRELLENGLGLPGRICDLTRDGAAAVAVSGWLPPTHDSALALALQAGRRAKETCLDFRQGEFAPPRRLLGSKKQLAALGAVFGILLLASGGWLLVDSRMRQKRHDSLTAKMEKMFQESFPGVKPGPDPLMHMRSLRRGIGTSAEVMPIFTDEKRALFVLADISARIPSSIQLQVDRFVLDQNSVSIKGTTDAFNNVNTMQSLLNKSSRYSEVRIVSAAKGKDENSIQFELRLQLRADGGAS